MAYDFHYTPTGTGVISGKEVLEQTEDAINDLGNTAISGVQEALDKAEQALTNSENAVDDAQTALNTANNAEGVAIQAQTDVGNLSGTVTNIGNRVTTAEGNITNLQGRMTTAEGNITNLQGRMTTAEGNIGNLQTAVSTAQATANSAQQTATTARQQSYVFRYSSTALVASSTNSNALLDNTDNLKVGDKVIDSSGVLFSITAIDTANSTFTIGTALIDLAQDSDVVHKSGNETIGGEKTFSDLQIIAYGTQYKGARDAYILPEFAAGYSGLSITTLGFAQALKIGNFVLDANNKPSLDTSKGYIQFATGENNGVNTCVLEPRNSISSSLGISANRWSKIYGTEYYYGSNNVEFSTKFVTTDTDQTVDGKKQLNAYLTLNGSQMNNEFSNNARTCAYLTANRDTVGKSGVFVSKFRQNRAQGAMSGTDVVQVCFDVFENEVRTNRLWYLNWLDWNNDVPETVEIRSMCNKVDYKLTHINGLNPSALSLPDLANGIDISSYIDVNQTSEYTASLNGYISICGSASGTNAIVIKDKNYDFAVSTRSMLVSSNQLSYITIPVLANHTYEIICGSVTTIDYAKFYPCQGNV